MWGDRGQRACRPLAKILEHRKLTASACLKRIRQFQQGLLGYFSPHYHLWFYIVYLSRLHTPYFISTIFPTPLARSPSVRCHTHLPLSFCAIVFSLCYIIHAYMTCLLPLCFTSCAAKNWHHFLKTVAF